MKTKRDSGFECAASQVLVTNGGKHAVFTAFAALCDPGDEVICPAPYWTTYPEAIALAGGVPKIVDTTEETGFRVTVEQLEAACDAAHQGAAVRQPRQPIRRGVPAGAGRGDRPMGRRARHVGRHRRDLRAPHVRAARVRRRCQRVVPDLADQCVIVNGVAKTYAMTGWRVGWMIGPADVVKAAINFQTHATSNVGNVAQRAALAAVSGDLEAVARCVTRSSGAAARCTRCSSAIPGVTCLEPQGAFYCFPNLKGLLGRELAGGRARPRWSSPTTCCPQPRSAFVPGEAFGTPGYGRFSFALSDEALVEGLDRVAALG